MKTKILTAIAVFFALQVTAQVNIFRGPGFEISYPTSFKSHGAPGSLDINPESVFFSSPDNLVEFYIFSPMGRGVANDIALKSNEKQSAVQATNGKATNAKFWTITAKDNSYERTYQESIDVKSGDNWVIGLKYKNQAAFAKYRNEYLAFKKSYRKTNAGTAVATVAVGTKLNASFAYEEKDDAETGSTLTTVYLLYKDNKIKVGDMRGSADNIEKGNYKMRQIPNTAIAACGAWFGGSGSYYYIIQKGDKLALFQGNNGEEDPKVYWTKLKEF
jgi:hypothetical protein